MKHFFVLILLIAISGLSFVKGKCALVSTIAKCGSPNIDEATCWQAATNAYCTACPDHVDCNRRNLHQQNCDLCVYDLCQPYPPYCGDGGYYCEYSGGGGGVNCMTCGRHHEEGVTEYELNFAQLYAEACKWPCAPKWYYCLWSPAQWLLQ